MRQRLANRLRHWGDRLDPDGSVRMLSQLSLTIEKERGWMLRHDGREIPLCYIGEDAYDRAHTEANDPPPRIDWTTGTIHPPGTSLQRGA